MSALKALLSSPLSLFLLMMLASVSNGLKQLAVVNQTGKPMSYRLYLCHWPETLSTIVGNVLAFVVLMSFDQLNITSAIGVGYGVNSLTDLLPTSRSYQLKATIDDPVKVNGKNGNG